MKVQIKKKSDEVSALLLDGDLDFHSSPVLRTDLSKLVDGKIPFILIDLKKVNYVDSSGLATFVELFQKMKAYGGKLILFNLSDGVRSIFEIAKLDSIFKLAKDENEALEIIAA